MNGRTLAILFVVVVILGAVVYFMSQNEGEVAGVDPDATAIPSPTPQISLLPNTTLNDVQRLEITRLEDDFQVAFVRQENGDWFQTVPTETMVISATMNGQVTSIVNMTSQSSIPADANPLSAYGLDNPQFEIVLAALRGEDTVRYTFFIGNTTPTGDRYYVQKQGDPRVHVLLSSVVEGMIALLDEPPIAVPTPEETTTNPFG